MAANKRKIRHLVKQTGLTLLEMEQNRKHWRLVVRTPDGRTMIIFQSVSPSDRRAELNQRAILRRFARGQIGRTT